MMNYVCHTRKFQLTLLLACFTFSQASAMDKEKALMGGCFLGGIVATLCIQHFYTKWNQSAVKLDQGIVYDQARKYNQAQDAVKQLPPNFSLVCYINSPLTDTGKWVYDRSKADIVLDLTKHLAYKPNSKTKYGEFTKCRHSVENNTCEITSMYFREGDSKTVINYQPIGNLAAIMEPRITYLGTE